jgi:hypothetical protein
VINAIAELSPLQQGTNQIQAFTVLSPSGSPLHEAQAYRTRSALATSHGFEDMFRLTPVPDSVVLAVHRSLVPVPDSRFTVRLFANGAIAEFNAYVSPPSATNRNSFAVRLKTAVQGTVTLPSTPPDYIPLFKLTSEGKVLALSAPTT